MNVIDIFAQPEVRNFLNFVTNPKIQEQLLLGKIVFIGFTLFFFIAVMYFYFKSTYIKHKFLQDTSEFLLWEAYGLREINKQWQQIMKKTKTGKERELRFALVEADDLFRKTLKNRGQGGKGFEETVRSINKKILPNAEEILQAHQMRDAMVHDPNYVIDVEQVKKFLDQYEKAIKSLSIS